MLTAGYFGLSALLFFLIFLGYHKALKMSGMEAKARNKQFSETVLYLSIWVVAYLSSLSVTKILQDTSLPPRFLLLVFVPIIIVLILFYRKNKDNPVLHAMPKSWPVYYQTFRIAVEVLILYTFYKGVLPQTATFEGFNFDILMGISAPFMAYFIFKDPVKHKTLARIWNVLGIFMVLTVAFIVATSIYLPSFWGATEPLVKMEFLAFPYLLLPGFLAPSAIFMHIVSLMQLRENKT